MGDGDQRAQMPMKEQKIGEELSTFHLQPGLASHEGEHATHGPEKVFNAGHEGALQTALAVLLTQLQEVEQVFVFHGEAGLCAPCRGQWLVNIGLPQ